MVILEPISTRNALIFKAVRLRALQDTPKAFGSTYAKECEFTDAEWIKRASRWSNETAAGYLAMDDGAACGLAVTHLDQDNATRAHLLSMWTAPDYRRRGVGRLLVNKIIVWAHLHGACILHLMVTSNNEPAILFYQRLGFTLTGRTEPYPNDLALIEYEMSRPIP